LGSLFSFISNPFESWIGTLALWVGSAGIAIIIFTVIIRLVLSPLQITQLRSARAMQRLQPKIQELRKKHGKDRQKLTEETMKLYKEHKVNPAMGCLPMLLQFPVLIGLFWALNGLGQSAHITIEALGKSKVTPWLTSSHLKSCFPGGAKLNSLSTVTPACWDKINHLTVYSQQTTLSPIVRLLSQPVKGASGWVPVKGGYALSSSYMWLSNKYHASLWGTSNVHHVYDLFHADFLWLSNGLGQHDPLYILPVLAGVTQWIQSRMMMQRSSDPQQQSMNTIMNFTPLIIVFFAYRYPSGLSLYWVTSTVIGIIISARITGWGTLPRVDRWVTGSGPLFGPGPAPRKSPSGPSPRKGGDGSGKSSSAEADIGETEDSEDEATTPTNNAARSMNGTKRRAARKRGGRRG
jgi:YidC/Oxa1 family membrane protein insertase